MAMWSRREILAPGALAPQFEIQDLEGTRHTLAEILGRGPALLAFFKVSCPVCQYTFPFLERVYQGAGREAGEVQIIGVSQDKAATTRGFNEEFGVSFPTLVDDAGKGYPVSNAFGLTSVPTLFLIEPDGKISMSGSGFSKQDLERLGHRMGVAPFGPGAGVPEQRPG
jgi:peroxiredoxin